MRRAAVLLAGFAILMTVGATAQESRSEISLQGTGFFTKDTNGHGISNTTTETGGFQVGYRYNINRWLAAEADYVTSAILKNILVAASGHRESRPTSTQSPEMWW